MEWGVWDVAGGEDVDCRMWNVAGAEGAAGCLRLERQLPTASREALSSIFNHHISHAPPPATFNLRHPTYGHHNGFSRIFAHGRGWPGGVFLTLR